MIIVRDSLDLRRVKEMIGVSENGDKLGIGGDISRNRLRVADRNKSPGTSVRPARIHLFPAFRSMEASR